MIYLDTSVALAYLFAEDRRPPAAFRGGVKREKNPAAVALGRLGGQKGRATTRREDDPEERAESARKAAEARWRIGQATNASLRKRLNIAERNHAIASRIIADALEAGLIKPFDPGNKSKRLARYVPFWA